MERNRKVPFLCQKCEKNVQECNAGCNIKHLMKEWEKTKKNRRKACIWRKKKPVKPVYTGKKINAVLQEKKRKTVCVHAVFTRGAGEGEN